MISYRAKECVMCSEMYTPASSNQKFCTKHTYEEKIEFSKTEEYKEACIRTKITSDKRLNNNREWKTKNRERFNKLAMESYHRCRKERPEWTAFLSARRRANYRQIKFTIDFEDITWNKICPILGIPIDNSDRDHQVSIDKIDPSKGYVKGNVCVISMKANRMKADLTVEILDKIREYIVKGLNDSNDS